MTVCYLYVLPLHNEDWLKLGHSNDPLRRAREFSPRYHDVFDLDQALLVETEGRADAAMLEKTLRRSLRPHRAPMPLGIRPEAGGHTEWLRGALPDLLDACRDSPLAAALHIPARNWFARAQWDQRLVLQSWASALLREFLLDPDAGGEPELPPPLRTQLRDAVDAFHAFGQRVDDFLPGALQRWYASYPGRPATPADAP